MTTQSVSDQANTQISDLDPDATGGVIDRLRMMMWPLRAKVFLLLLLSILAFAAGLQFWNHRTLFNSELRLTTDKHLVIASNLSMSLSRYARDVAMVFVHQASNATSGQITKADIVEHTDMMKAMDLDGFSVLSPENEVMAEYSLTGEPLDLPDAFVLDTLRTGTNTLLRGVQISDLLKIGDTRYFILGYNLPDERLAVGYLNTRYIKRVQEQIAFGELGHSAIFDATGRAVAHPVQKVEENMMDASGIPTVRRMMNGETGVDQFYSPPMDAQMIAGFTFVPETGWAVMVPQPIRELSASVTANLRQTDLFSVIVSLLLAIFGWIMTRFMARPIQRFTTAGLEIAKGNYDVDLPDQERSSLEMWRLNESLKTMIDKIRISNARLRLALEIEEKENKRKSEFLIIASHELRNPLSGVIGMLAVCKENSVDKDLAKYLDMAERSASQLNKIVDEMVHFAEEETDDVPIKIETFQASLELDQIAGLYQQRAHDAGLDFHYSLQDGLDVPIVTDRYRLFQIIGNLLENAIKYTAEGSVSMLVNFEQVPDSNQTWLDIRISDTGIGIDDSDLERIFEPFFQADGSFSRNYNGLGLGLSISKSMIEKLGGQIQCHSKKNKGSDFRLLIPVQFG